MKFLRATIIYTQAMPDKPYSSSSQIIQRLLRMENGVRKAARIFLFLDRQSAVEIIYDLPPALIAVLTREMAILRAQIQDFEEERHALESELGELAAILDLSPVNLAGANDFAFMEKLSPATQRAMAKSADQEALAAMVMNAPAEVAFTMIEALESDAQRKRLTDAMTRAGKSSKDWQEYARQLAREVSEEPTEAAEATKRRASSEGIASKATQRMLTKVESGDGPQSISEALSELSMKGGRPLTQQALAAMKDEALASAYASSNSAVQEALLGELSRNRRESVLEVAENLGDQALDKGAEQRALMLFISRLLREGEKILKRTQA